MSCIEEKLTKEQWSLDQISGVLVANDTPLAILGFISMYGKIGCLMEASILISEAGVRNTTIKEEKSWKRLNS